MKLRELHNEVLRQTEHQTRLYAHYNAVISLESYMVQHAADFVALIEAAENYLKLENVSAEKSRAATVAEENYSNPKRELAEAADTIIEVINASIVLRAALAPFKSESAPGKDDHADR